MLDNIIEHMKYYIIIFLPLFISLAAQADKKASEKEVQAYMEAVKEIQTENQILESEKFKSCKEDHKSEPKGTQNKKIKECFSKNLKNLKDEEVEKLSKNINLKSFDAKASESPDSIRKYLSKRLTKAIYGVDPDVEKDMNNLKKQNFVDHMVFYKLYEEQIGKNTLLEVSRYCLENFGYGDNEPAARVSILYPAGRNYKLLTAAKLNENKIFEKTDKSLKTTLANVLSEQTTKLWNHIKLFEFGNCTKYKSKGECEAGKGSASRSIELLEILKEVEFENALEPTGGDDISIKARYKLCAIQVISNMCEVYRCNKVYTLGTAEIPGTPEKIQKNCNDKYGISEVGTKPDAIKGSIACSLEAKIQEYRKMLAITTGTRTKLEGESNSRRGFSRKMFNDTFKGLYDGDGAEKGTSINELTTISSTELAQGVDVLKNSKAKGEELEKECFDNMKLKAEAKKNPKCSALFDNLNQDQIADIEMDIDSKMQFYLKKLEKIKEKNDPKKLKAFLIENGLEEYIGKLDELDNDPSKIATIISQNYEAKKKATIDRLKAKFANADKIAEENANPDDLKKINKENQSSREMVARQKLEDIKTQKRKIQNLFNYSNIVSSYLEINDDNGKAVGTTGSMRDIELSHLEDSKEDGESTDNTAVLTKKYFTASGESVSGHVEYKALIDEIVAPGEKKKTGDE